MKLRKKLISLFVAASLTLGTGITAFAAPKNATAADLGIVSKAVTTFVELTNASKTISVLFTKRNDVITALTHSKFDAFVSVAAKYLAHHPSLSASDLQTVISDITDVRSKYPGVTTVADYQKLSEADKTVIRNDVRHAAAALGLTVTRSADGSYVVKDSTTGSVIDVIVSSKKINDKQNKDKQNKDKQDKDKQNHGK
ncbi:hypothetical protein [Clostridium pasteurianum]|uniref:Uncharacterized protein n=1 Tax=Clostridium pasteurianum BC1 TaxID=86416 RepID=R4K011_CLOPA|nr:hypothetical protein [Clostridium pasteurianum]AGK95908.1 hypothetical protein Clopa_0891 [Clostridium pasteurianum BC1]